MTITRIDESNISLKSAFINIACLILLYLDYEYLNYVSNKTFILCSMIFFALSIVLTFVLDIINIIKGIIHDNNRTE
jgi:ABC-type siderophore export system fused ATPase/permease subunit